MHDLMILLAKIGQITEAISQVGKTQGILPTDYRDLYMQVLGREEGSLEALRIALDEQTQQYRKLVDTRYQYLNPNYAPIQDFVIYWLNGRYEKVSGPTIEEAAGSQGYGMGAVGAVDFYTSGSEVQYLYSKLDKKWYKMTGTLPPEYGKINDPSSDFTYNYVLRVSANLDQIEKMVPELKDLFSLRSGEVPNRAYACFLPEDESQAFELYGRLKSMKMVAFRNWLED